MLKRLSEWLFGPRSQRMRLLVVVPVDTYHKIQALQRLAECVSTADLLRRALTLYELVLTHAAKDGKLILRDPDGSEVELEV